MYGTACEKGARSRAGRRCEAALAAGVAVEGLHVVGGIKSENPRRRAFVGSIA